MTHVRQSTSTRLSNGQKAAKYHIENSNGMFKVKSQKKDVNFKYDQEIKIDNWERIDKYTK